MMKKSIKYFIISTFLMSLLVVFPYTVFGNTDEVIKTNEDLPEVSQKDVKGEKDSCCEKSVEAAKAEVDSKILESLPVLPDIILVNQDGKRMRASEILKGKITVINFIYTSCKSVCQILTNNFRQLEKSLDGLDKDGEVQLISISIDPEIDTPPRLRQYAEMQRINLSRWTLLVSGVRSIERLSRALGFSNIDKATHAPGVIIWDDIDKRWQRFAGITPPHIVLKELSKLPAISG